MSSWRIPQNTAVITGGASGIGLAAARSCLQAGMNVAIADRNAESLATAEAELLPHASSPSSLLSQSCDVTDVADVEALRDTVLQRFGAIHCLMNNAGRVFAVGQPWENADELEQTLRVNLGGGTLT